MYCVELQNLRRELLRKKNTMSKNTSVFSQAGYITYMLYRVGQYWVQSFFNLY